MQVANLPRCTRHNTGVRTRGLYGPQGAHVCVSYAISHFDVLFFKKKNKVFSDYVLGHLFFYLFIYSITLFYLFIYSFIYLFVCFLGG